jgi:hypothetical protein
MELNLLRPILLQVAIQDENNFPLSYFQMNTPLVPN